MGGIWTPSAMRWFSVSLDLTFWSLMVVKMGGISDEFIKSDCPVGLKHFIIPLIPHWVIHYQNPHYENVPDTYLFAETI